MDDEHGYAIPAANIGDTDLVALAQTNPEAAKEIARLVDRMNCGEETNEEFLRLCQMLFDVGSVAASEILLRRNLDFYGGHALYARLFGAAKQEEFDTAIEAFNFQFDLELVLVAQKDFLVSTFHSRGGPLRSDAFSLLSRPCEIKFGYIEQDKIEKAWRELLIALQQDAIAKAEREQLLRLQRIRETQQQISRLQSMGPNEGRAKQVRMLRRCLERL